eukprot:m51a1_g95 hypothetical protein (259) ;mRNA; r:297013-297789
MGLTDGLLSAVFSWLPTKDLCRTAPVVCRRWRHVSWLPELVSERDLADAASASVLHSDLWQIATSQFRFSELKVWRHPVPDLGRLSCLLSNLRELEVASGTSLGTESAVAISQAGSTLERLVLPPETTDAFVVRIAPTISGLRQFIAPGAALSDAGVTQVARWATGLVEIDLANVCGLTDAALLSLSSHCDLEVVHIGTDLMTEGAFAAMCLRLPSLKMVDLRSCMTFAAQCAARRVITSLAPHVFVRIQSVVDGTDF